MKNNTKYDLNNIQKMYYKQDEIKQYAIETIKERLEYDKEYLDQEWSDIHHDLFNTDYYVVYYADAIKFCNNRAFDIIEEVKEYQEQNFGEVTTDFSNSIEVVNMYVYIIGEYILDDVLKEFKQIA